MSTPLKRQDDWEVSPPARLDEAFALLRSLPVSSWAWCVVGPAPMVLGLLFFWTDLTRSGTSALTGGEWAAVMALVYAWLKVTQALFARSVWGCLLPEGGLPALTWGGWFRRTSALLMVGAVSWPVHLLAAQVVLPFGWVFAFFHHATVLAYVHDLGTRPLRTLVRESGRLSVHEPLAHHFSLLLLGVLASLVWGAVFALGLLLPYLLKILTGVESEFTRNALAVALNPLYFCVTVGVTWMMISPYVRVAYVLRTFGVVSRRTGDDLLGRLQAVQRSMPGSVRLGVWVMMAVLSLPVAAGEEVSSPPPSVSLSSEDVESERFSEVIRSTLATRDYQWRLPRGEREARAGESGFWAAVRRALDKASESLKALDRAMSELGRALRKLLGGGGPAPAVEGGTQGVFTGDALRGVLYVLGGCAVLGVLGAAWYWWRRRGRSGPVVSGSAPVSTPVNLADEETLASALPGEEWLRLARAQYDGGDLRLAVRAAFLATLASLGEQRLIDIARSKTNRDYARELRLRAAARREVPEVFGRSVSVFERAWYGLHEVSPEWVRELLDNHQRLTPRGTAA